MLSSGFQNRAVGKSKIRLRVSHSCPIRPSNVLSDIGVSGGASCVIPALYKL